MSDIHQEWKELREKNGNFINHLDGEMAKIEKKQVELKRREQTQNLADAGAFAMRFVAPPPFNCCQDDRDILKALNKAQADRIEHLEEEILARKEQQQIDLAVKKDLDEKLDKATADYRALWVERDNLAETASRMDKTIRDLDERNGTLRERLAQINASLKRSIQENSKLRSDAAYIDKMRKAQEKEIKRLEKEVGELKEENKRLKCDNKALAEGLSDQTRCAIDLMSAREALKHEIETLHGALDIAAKDADANFERGKIKGMEEIWDKLKDAYANRTLAENEKIFGYPTVGKILDNLSPTWFINKAEELHAKDIHIGDEVIANNPVSSDDPDYNIGIVTSVDEDHRCFAVIGPNFEGCFDETDILSGNVKKTGNHYDSIPLDYLT